MGTSRFITFAAALAFLTASGLSAPSTGLDSIRSQSEEMIRESALRDSLSWYDDLDNALGVAKEEYRPVVVFFFSSADGWSARMRAQVFSDESVKRQMEHYVRVEVAVEENEETAANYLVRGIPAIRILSAEGRALQGRDGFVGAPQLIRMLRSALNAEYLKQTDPGFQELLTKLEANTISTEDWHEIMLSLGEPQKREPLRKLVLKLEPFPRAELVKLLSDSRLAVRLGAIELLEELAGSDFGFDPWMGSSAASGNEASLDKWNDWLGSSDSAGVKSIYSVLTEEQISSYLRDIVSGNRERSVRASRMLRNGGSNTARSLLSFLENNQEIAPAARNRIRELYYSLTVPSVSGSAPDTIAHRLIFGNLDSRLETITELKNAGPAATPVLSDFLNDEDPLIRETSIDALLTAGGANSIGVVQEHLKQEDDNDVVIAALRTIGVNEIRNSSTLVAKYVDHEEEDIAIMALESLGALRAQDQSDAIVASLKDGRWRVRVAALEALRRFKESQYADDVRPLLDDPDEFVRVASVQAIASMDDTAATPKLVQLYKKHPETRGPVISALLSMNQPLPESLKKDLRASEPDALLSVIDAVGQEGGENVDIITEFVEHENLDVACAAIRVVSNNGMSFSSNQELIYEVLKEGQPEKVEAVLDSLEFEEAQYQQYSRRFTSNRPALSRPPEVQAIFDSFLQRPESSSSLGSTDPLIAVFEAIEPYLRKSYDDSIRHNSSVILTKAGNPDAVEQLKKSLISQSVSERKRVADSMYRASDSVLPILVSLMRDRSEDVRKEASSTLLYQGSRKEFVAAFFEEVTRPRALLKPWETDIDYLDNGAESGPSKGIANEAAKDILESSGSTALRSLAALTLRFGWNYGDEEYLLPLTEVDEPELRRAAWYAIGVNSKETIRDHLDTIANDPSEKVRAILPYVLGNEDRYFVHYFDSEHTQRFWDSGRENLDFEFSGDPFGSGAQKVRLEEEEIKILHQLSRDSSPAVRIDSSFLLMAAGEKPDAADLQSTLSSFPDRESIQQRVSDYVETNFRNLDPNYKFLLNHIDPQRISSSELPNIYAYFKSGPNDTESNFDWKERADTPREKITDKEVGRTGSRSEEPSGVEIVYFFNPGCKECARVEEQLAEIQASFPRLSVSKQNIREARSAQLNEVLSERFGVPEKIRMVAPAIFTGDGYLIKDEIDSMRLGNLIVRSSASGNSTSGWSALNEKDIATASQAIESRFSSVGVFVILSAGFLDGINPCAFATIILFLSYLQIARHGPRQIIMVGLSFILAVFLTYFALGLGLVEIVSRLQFLKGAGMVLNVILAGFALVIMFLSLRDGVLCVQGRLADTTLQLPGFLKDRIRKVARTGARHHRFVVAAFVSGVIISLLELACTGQVYLPTINYMVQEGKTSAYFFLLIYNIAFVFPLLVIFILAFFGMRSDALIAFQAKHSAAIKFATAALFLALFLLLLFQILP
ncbi:MAG: hypothetical protein CMO55_19705 [Verrucomicrobiales bacterium]|nr:hypothetical protein [Verrucomicrobiales bacterium]